MADIIMGDDKAIAEESHQAVLGAFRPLMNATDDNNRKKMLLTGLIAATVEAMWQTRPPGMTAEQLLDALMMVASAYFQQHQMISDQQKKGAN